MMSFHPSKGYSWKQANVDQQKKQPNTILRAQETLALRHWMDRTIEMSAVKIVQSRQAMDQADQEDASKTSTDISSALRGKIKHK
jgi:hypothetical protein